jgi:hypothetical protein
VDLLEVQDLVEEVEHQEVQDLLEVQDQVEHRGVQDHQD